MAQQKNNLQSTDAIDATASLVRALDHAGAFDHPVGKLRFLETHISWIVLTGKYAYKIKKPVNFGFLDFSTLEQRHYYCREELRLNRRFAPRIYLDVIEIRGSQAAPRLHGEGEAIEYALKMLEFPQRCLLSHHASAGTLDVAIIDALARRVTEFHAVAEIAATQSSYGSADSVMHWSEENLQQLQKRIPAEQMPASFAQLRRWYREQQELPARLEKRRIAGRIRECHGDLHLGNLALIEDEVTPFDCIEFNPELRWIDTSSEAAFIAMDLQARGYPGLCWRFISRYLESSADYDAVELLRYYIVYRALVRAKVEALRARPATQEAALEFSAAFRYLELAQQWAAANNPGLILMHGLSGSGKSTVAAQLVEALGAIQLRSDVIRKQLFELAADADSGSAVNRGIYSEAATEQTYRRLGQIAQLIAAAGFCAIVDASFLLRSQRRGLLDLASTGDYPCIVIECNAPLAELRRRISERTNDPSEATLRVLDQQVEKREPVSAQEIGITGLVALESGGPTGADLNRIRDLLSAGTSVDRH